MATITTQFELRAIYTKTVTERWESDPYTPGSMDSFTDDEVQVLSEVLASAPTRDELLSEIERVDLRHGFGEYVIMEIASVVHSVK